MCRQKNLNLKFVNQIKKSLQQATHSERFLEEGMEVGDLLIVNVNQIHSIPLCSH